MKEDEVKISDEQRESCRMPSADGLEAEVVAVDANHPEEILVRPVEPPDTPAE